MYFNQLLLAARKIHVVYFDELFGAAHYIHFISNQDSTKKSFEFVYSFFFENTTKVRKPEQQQ